MPFGYGFYSGIIILMKATVAIVLTLLLGTMFVSLFHMSVGMEMSSCTSMSPDEVVCPTNLMGYLEAWKTTFSTLIAPTLTLLLTLGAVALVASVAPHLVYRRIIRLASIAFNLYIYYSALSGIVFERYPSSKIVLSNYCCH